MKSKKADAYTMEITPQFLADLRALVSIAVWIRSEQMAQRDVVRLLTTSDPSKWRDIPMPATRIDTRALVLGHCVADHESAIKWWTRLDSALKVLDAANLEPSWRHQQQPKEG